eukprot:13842926-Alexandrium_andersonii.AAC.1
MPHPACWGPGQACPASPEIRHPQSAQRAPVPYCPWQGRGPSPFGVASGPSGAGCSARRVRRARASACGAGGGGWPTSGWRCSGPVRRSLLSSA